MSEPEQLTKLRRKLNAKTREIEALVASTHGLGDINDLDRTALRGLETEVETMIEKYENSLLAGDIIEECDLTVFLYQRMRGYCIGMISSRWQAKGANVCGTGGL